MPFISSLTLGKDYAIFPIQHQMELMFSLKMGSFPLYVPGFAGGQTASALMLGQIFHPLTHMATLLPGYWSGNALEWNTLLRLFSLGLAHLAIFVFVRDLGVSKLFSFIVSFITVYIYECWIYFAMAPHLKLDRFSFSMCRNWLSVLETRKIYGIISHYRINLLARVQWASTDDVLWINRGVHIYCGYSLLYKGGEMRRRCRRSD